MIERDSEGNVISRGIDNERNVCYVPRVGEVISLDSLDFYINDEGDYERCEDGRVRVRDVEFYRVLAVVHEETEDDRGSLGYCTNIIIERIKGSEVKFLSDCMYENYEYFIEPKTLND